MKKKGNFEMRLYEHLGVLGFQKMVFKLEKVIHFKDKGKNINYHFKNRNIDELKEFRKFLYFNGFIHVRNTAIVASVIALQAVFLSPWLYLYTIPSLVKNLYCVMLQRYNYIRINKVIEAKEQKIARKMEMQKAKFEEAQKEHPLNIKNKEVCLAQIKALRNFLQGQDDAFLDQSSTEMLNLLKTFINPSADEKVADRQMKK